MFSKGNGSIIAHGWDKKEIPDQYITTMLLNEVQKQYHRAEAEAKVITAQEQKIDSQQQQIDEMQQRLSRLETLTGTPVATVAKN